MAVSAPPASPEPTLRRALGRWDLTAIGVNQVIGGAIFLMPSQVAAQIGAWAPIGMILMGIASLSVALCFAEVGSRFSATGGPYLYAREAFGAAVGFEVGWLLWLANIPWFHHRVLSDERRLHAKFGAEYADYRARVRRWIPSIL